MVYCIPSLFVNLPVPLTGFVTEKMDPLIKLIVIFAKQALPPKSAISKHRESTFQRVRLAHSIARLCPAPAVKVVILAVPSQTPIWLESRFRVASAAERITGLTIH